MDQQFADLLGAGAAARLAGFDNAAAARCQPLRETPQLGRLSGALAALEGDEAPLPEARGVARRAQGCPMTRYLAAAPMRPKEPSFSTSAPAWSGKLRGSRSGAVTVMVATSWPFSIGAGIGAS